MIGDRLSTDMIFANMNKMTSIYIEPFNLFDYTFSKAAISTKIYWPLERYIVDKIFKK